MSAKTKKKDTCEICGYRSDLGAVKNHYIVPTELSEQAEMLRSQILCLCRNCSYELDTWYSTKIADTIYDSRTKHFGSKSPLNIVKEYQSVFKGFVKYKKEKK